MIWNRKCDNFAKFYQLCFLPHNETFGNIVSSPSTLMQSDLSWTSFCSTIEKMENSKLLIDRIRLQTMFTFIHGFQTNYTNRVLLSNFRHRQTTRWSEEEQIEASNLYNSIGCNGNGKKFNNDEDEDFYLDQDAIKFFGTAAQRYISTESAFQKNQMQSINTIFNYSSILHTAKNSSNNVTFSNDQVCILHVVNSSKLQKHSINSINRLTKSIQDANLHTQSSTQENTTTTNFFEQLDNEALDAINNKAIQFIQNQKLSQCQYDVALFIHHFFAILRKYRHQNIGEEIYSHLHTTYKIKAPNILITGDPGSGKSYLIDTICELASIMEVGHVATCSYNGIAAVNIDGSTICSLFSIFESKNLQQQEKSEENIGDLKLLLNIEKLCCLVVDEISTIDARIIAIIHKRLQKAVNNNLPFGGIPVVFVGDFNQLGPVKKTFIPQDMMKWATRKTSALHHIQSSSSTTHIEPSISSIEEREQALQNLSSPNQRKRNETLKMIQESFRFKINSNPYLGCSLLKTFKRFHLTQQQRSDDEDHNKFVKHLSDGKCIQIEQILQYKKLSEKDVNTCPLEWKYAPVLVATNAERLNIARMKAQLWAVEHKTYLFKWRCKIGRQENRPGPDDMAKLCEEHAFFWQFFVTQAPYYLTNNINGELSIVNGTPVTGHSLTMHDKDTFDTILEQLGNLDYGSEVEIEEPLAVNFSFDLALDGKKISKKRQCQLNCLKKYSNKYGLANKENPNEIILPITSSMSASGRKYTKHPYMKQNLLSPIATVSVKEPFPFDLAFAITVHKAQGRTIKRVVIDLTKHPQQLSCMKYASVFVAMSRVKNSNHIRLLETSKVSARAPQYNYIDKLKPNKYIPPFLHGYNDHDEHSEPGVEWNPQLACDYSDE